jgi:adenylate cyclase
VPIVNKHGKVIGVTQVLNKRGGPFTGEDESRLRAFTAQISIALENAKLFADVQNMKNYNEAMLESMSNAVITLDEAEKIATCNAAGLRIFKSTAAQILHKPAAEFFSGSNAWVQEKFKRVGETQTSELAMEAELMVGEEKLSVNLTALPLLSMEKKRIGSMLMLEDISSEKRMRSTMSRLMDPGIADQMLAGGVDTLGGKNVQATVLFSDIRGFTTITEQLGAQGTVALLNEYFTLMVDCIQREAGFLDKFIGDAIMAAFGIPVAHDDDADRSVRTAISMIRELWAWNKVRNTEGKLPVDIGIGLNTDNVVSGTIGSKKRMDYTIIGDGVNLAARLESACKQYGAHILISEFTNKAVARHLLQPRARPGGGQGQDPAGGDLRNPRLPHRGKLSQHDGCPAPFQGRPAEVPAAEMGRRQGRIQRGAGAQRPRQGGEDVHRALRPFHRQPAGRRTGMASG